MRVATVSRVQMSKERGTNGTRRTCASTSAARWLTVSRPPASTITSSYFGAIRSISVRTAGPVSLMHVYPAPPSTVALRNMVKSAAVSWSSASTRSTSWPACARIMARLVAIVLLPLPPLPPPATMIMAYLIHTQNIVSISKRHSHKACEILFRYRKDTHIVAKEYLIGESRATQNIPLLVISFRYLITIFIIFIKYFFDITIKSY